jgi:hypothetical protein
MGVSGQRHSPAALPPERDPVPVVQEAGRAPGPIWTGVENLASTGVQPPNRQARAESLHPLRCPRVQLAGYRYHISWYYA